MSYKLVNDVWNSAVPHALKPLAAVMATFGNDAGDNVYPGVKQLAWLLGIKPLAVRRKLRQLRALHVLIPVSPMRWDKEMKTKIPVGGATHATRYRLQIPDAVRRPPYSKGCITVHPSEREKGVSDDTLSAKKRVSKMTQRVSFRAEKGVRRDTRSVNDPLDPSGTYARDAGFEAFWDAYPKKENKANAKRIWQKLAPDAVLLATMIAALDWQCQQDSWIRERGRYVPMPATWLSAARWTDQPSTTPHISDHTAMLARATKGFLSS